MSHYATSLPAAEHSCSHPDHLLPGKAVPVAPTTRGARLATAVIFVRDLTASVEFYRDLFNMEVTVHNQSAALLVLADEFQLYLRGMGPRAPRALGGVGVQYVIWAAADREDFDRSERFLKDTSAHVSTRTVDGFRLVEGRDPNELPVMVSFPGPDHAPRHTIMPRVYGW